MAREKKYCKTCGKLLTKGNKTGYCNIHRDRTGANNSFYGKKHSSEVIEKIKVKCSEASKKLWTNDEYREKVIFNTTGLKRSEEFKETQRKNAYKQFEDKSQRDIRSQKMKETWQNGNITILSHPSINKSKKEIILMNKLKEQLGDNFEIDKVIHYIDSDNKNKWLYPDGCYNNIVVEYNGDYWHANPEKYKENDIVHHNIIAKDIWKNDSEKIKLYNNLGYKVIVIWEKDYKENPEKIIDKIVGEIINDRAKR